MIAKLNDHKPASIGRFAYFWRHACGYLHSAGVAEKQGMLRRSA